MGDADEHRPNTCGHNVALATPSRRHHAEYEERLAVALEESPQMFERGAPYRSPLEVQVVRYPSDVLQINLLRGPQKLLLLRV